MRTTIVAMVLAFFVANVEGSQFFTTSVSDHKCLATFDSNSDVSLKNIGYATGFGGDGGSTFLDFSQSGRLFGAMLENFVSEFDPKTGQILKTVEIGNSHIEGLAVANNGLVYISIEAEHRIDVLNFDAKTKTSLTSWATKSTDNTIDIDDMDFDNQGNLIGHDINGTGEIYNIPLDGSSPEIVAIVPKLSAWSMTFSASENAFFFLTDPRGTGNMRTSQLWRLAWNNGQAGLLEHVVDIDSQCFGIAAIPEPSILGCMVIGLLFFGRKNG